MDPLIHTEENTPKRAYLVDVTPRRNSLNQHIVAFHVFYKPIQFV